MPRKGVEPLRLSARDPKSRVAASYTTSAAWVFYGPRRRGRGSGLCAFSLSFAWRMVYLQLFIPPLEKWIMLPADAGPVSSNSGPWYKLLTRYHWFVLIVAALGWLFHCLD